GQSTRWATLHPYIAFPPLLENNAKWLLPPNVRRQDFPSHALNRLPQQYFLSLIVMEVASRLVGQLFGNHYRKSVPTNGLHGLLPGYASIDCVRECFRAKETLAFCSEDDGMAMRISSGHNPVEIQILPPHGQPPYYSPIVWQTITAPNSS